MTGCAGACNIPIMGGGCGSACNVVAVGGNKKCKKNCICKTKKTTFITKPKTKKDSKK